jgi:signal transduction histidine kinase
MQDDYKEVLIVLIVGLTIFLILVGIVVFILLFYQKKRFQHRGQLAIMKNSIANELLKTQLETREETFLQIGNEIHDNVGQLLSSTKILLAITERSLKEVPDTLHTASETLTKAIQDLRSLSKTLNREWLGKFNIIENLAMEVERINTSGTITTSLFCSDNYLPLKPEAQVMLFRVVQEAMQNCLKHSDASVINIHLHLGPENIGVKIFDNGSGMPVFSEKPGGIGLLTMRHRARMLGGDVEWRNPDGLGTEVAITIPIQQENKSL